MPPGKPKIKEIRANRRKKSPDARKFVPTPASRFWLVKITSPLEVAFLAERKTFTKALTSEEHRGYGLRILPSGGWHRVRLLFTPRAGGWKMDENIPQSEVIRLALNQMERDGWNPKGFSPMKEYEGYSELVIDQETSVHRTAVSTILGCWLGWNESKLGWATRREDFLKYSDHPCGKSVAAFRKFAAGIGLKSLSIK